ncbi:MAG: PP2C family serine/threonine-protein phosphatase [Polyangiaceae bacterium]
MSQAKGRTRLSAAGRTDTGRQRRHNEDHVLVKPELDLLVVADGMGGHNAGDIASRLTTTSMANFFEATTHAPVPGPPADDEVDLEPAGRRLVAAIRKANRDVFEISSTIQQHQGMGSTIVAAHVSPQSGTIHIGHVGDSRCYRIRADTIELLTRDHSLVNDALAIKPDLSEEELARLPRNIITRALGMKDAVKVDHSSHELVAGDIYLLCSDGLSGMVSDDQILEVFAITDDLGEICDLLVAMANEAGGADNITAVVTRVEERVIRHISAPEVEVEVAVAPASVALPSLRDIVPEDTLDLLEAGAEIEVSEPMHAPSGRAPVARCGRCDAELIVGNRFCVECGTRTET